MNNVILLGRVARDPELRTTSSGISVTGFTVAVERSYTKHGEERQVDFIPVVAWKHTAELVCKYFPKGTKIALQGRLETRKYDDKKTGEKRTAYEVIAEEVSFCESKGKNGNSGGNNEGAYTNAVPEDFAEVNDDDLPF